MRAAGDPAEVDAAAEQALERAIAGLDPELPIFELRTLKEIVAASWARGRFDAALGGGFAVLALVLAAVGIYGVLGCGFDPGRFGVDHSDVVWELRYGVAVVALGLVLGAAAAWATGGLLADLRPGVDTTDLMSWLVALALMMMSAAVSLWLHGKRIARVEPGGALRDG